MPMVDAAFAHLHLCYKVQFCWVCIYPRCSGQWSFPAPILRVSCNVSKPIMVILSPLLVVSLELGMWCNFGQWEVFKGAPGDNILPPQRLYMGRDTSPVFTWYHLCVMSGAVAATLKPREQASINCQERQSRKMERMWVFVYILLDEITNSPSLFLFTCLKVTVMAQLVKLQIYLQRFV